MSATKFSLTHTLCLTLACLYLSNGQAATPLSADSVDRAALTQATLELQRDLLLAREKHDATERLGLAIYLDIDELARTNIDGISIVLDGQTVIQQALTGADLEALTAGAMKQLGVIPLPPGRHTLQTTVKRSGRNVTKSVELNKSNGRDHLKITVTSLLQQRIPEITYTHETWAAVE